MRSTRQRNIIFKPSFALAREIFLNPNGFPELDELTQAILQLLNDLEAWNFSHANMSKNMHATRIAESTTKDNQTQILYSPWVVNGQIMCLLKKGDMVNNQLWFFSAFYYLLSSVMMPIGIGLLLFIFLFMLFFLFFVLYTLVLVWRVIGTPPFDYDEYFSVKKKTI